MAVPKQEGKTLRVGAQESFKAARGPTGRVQALRTAAGLNSEEPAAAWIVAVLRPVRWTEEAPSAGWIGGFGLVAYPAEYGASGIMTFIVNHDGVVYEKDLGENTEETAQAMTIFNPDGTWKKVE